MSLKYSGCPQIVPGPPPFLLSIADKGPEACLGAPRMCCQAILTFSHRISSSPCSQATYSTVSSFILHHAQGSHSSVGNQALCESGESYFVKDGLYSGTSHVYTWCVYQTLCCVPRCVLLFLNPSRVLSVTKEAKVPRQRKQLRKVQRD